MRLQTYLGDGPQEKRHGFLGQRSPGAPNDMSMVTTNPHGRLDDVASRVAKAMFAISFSSKMIDYLDNVLNQVSDMSIFL